MEKESITWKKVLREICLGKKNIYKVCLIRKKRCYYQEKKSIVNGISKEGNIIGLQIVHMTSQCPALKNVDNLNQIELKCLKKNGTFYLVVNYTFWIVSACVHVSVWMCKVKWSDSHSVVFDSLWPVDYSLQGSSVNGILQARILQWVAIPFPRGSSQSRDQTQVSCIAGRFFTVWATREANILIVII